MKPATFEYVRAGSVAEALDALDDPEARVLAGGQSLVPLMNLRLAVPGRLVDVNDLTELDAVQSDDGEIVLGALCRHRLVEFDPVVREHAPLLAEGVTSATMLEPDDTLTIREQVVERYLRRNHPRWLEGIPTASLWHPRVAEGRAAGAVVPQGEWVASARRVVGDDQPLPDGILVLGRNAHFGGRAETISFDVVARDLGDALAIGKAAGQQHTIPGSVGATSGTFDSGGRLALLWEVQPNVYKPAGERNRAIAKIYRRHRNWHLITLAAALEWLIAQNATIFVLTGAALAITHEVNPAKPVSEAIATLHDRTVESVTLALGMTLIEPADADERLLLDSEVMNHALRKHVLRQGSAGLIRRMLYSARSSE